MLYYIYKLLDPINLEIKYVGFTYTPLEKRLKEHIKDSKNIKKHSHKIHWFRSLAEKKLIPKLELIETIQGNRDEAYIREQYWISLFKSEGISLVNSTDGGAGVQGFQHSESTKTVLSQKTKEAWERKSDEEKRYMSELTSKRMLGNQYSKGRKDTELLRLNKGKRFSGALNPRWKGNILQKSLSGEILGIFTTLDAAQESTGINRSVIHLAIKKQKPHKEFIWEYDR